MFSVQEERFCGLVKQARTPVLGLLGGLVPADTRVAIEADLQVMPSAQAFSQRLDKYPALFGVWLAEHVMLGLGQDGHFNTYIHVRKAIGGVEDLNANERELLWRSFRRAIFKLGIQPLPRVTGTNFMVDEYVRQAGVPIAFADDLALRMLRTAKRIGLPDEDDHEGLLTWQATLLGKLVAPFSTTARKAVERDTQAYYTRTFLRVHSNGGRATSGDVLELALAKAFTSEGASGSIKRAVIPQLIYRDGLLGIAFSPTPTPTSYQVTCGKTSLLIHTDERGGFRPLANGLHSEVNVLRADGEKVLSVKLWQDQASNRLLVFNDAGRLRATAQLGQEDAVELPPGNYVALCRFAPTNIDDWEEVCEAPRLVEVLLDIRPGSEVALVNGPAKVCFVGHNLPSFRIEGAEKESLEHSVFRHGSIRALVEIPLEWRQAGQQSYEIRISSDDLHGTAPLNLDSNGVADVELSSLIRALKIQPGMRRVVIELARTGDARTLHRQSVLYWVGLTAVSYGMQFSYESRPRNLVSSSSIGLNFGELHTDLENAQSRVLRLMFDVGNGRLVQFSWNRPGVFVEVELPEEGGISTVIPKPLGATETVSLTSTKRIIVSASEPGFLTLGNMRTFVDFGHRPSKVLPASFLASRLEPGARTLAYETNSGTSIPLLVLSQPHVVTEVGTSRLANVFEIRVSVTGEPTDVAITGKRISTGLEVRAEHELMAGTWHTNDLARMQVYSAGTGGSHVIYVLIDIETLKPGVWTLGFGARIGGVWGRLEDPDEGRIAVAFAVNALGKEVSGSEVVAESEELELAEVTARLARLNEHFRQFWSPVCWEQQHWLGSYYSALIGRLRDHEEEFITQLADMAMESAADDIRQGFQAKQSVPASLIRIFAQPRGVYKRINTKDHPLSVALRAMPDLRGSVSQAFGATLHPSAAFAFSNCVEVMAGKRPRGFQLTRYRQVLTQTSLDGAYRLDDASFIPESGELLGPLHLAHAWRDLERGYTMSLLLPSKRRSLAIALARSIHQKSAVFDQTVPPGLRGQELVLRLNKFDSDAANESEQQMHENVERIANACSWFAWYCRMEVRKEGAISQFQANLTLMRKHIEVLGPVVNDCLAYYLHVAPAMFSFYLLLWELVLTIEIDPSVQNV